MSYSEFCFFHLVLNMYNFSILFVQLVHLLLFHSISHYLNTSQVLVHVIVDGYLSCFQSLAYYKWYYYESMNTNHLENKHTVPI